MSSAWTGQSGSPTRMLLLRHGQTVLSIDRRYSGHGDPELTTVGWAQAAGAAARLATYPEITAVLTSPLRRARQTAESVAQTTGAPLEVRRGLIETDFGEWEGLTFVEARERDPELHAKWLGAEDVAPPGGESLKDTAARVLPYYLEYILPRVMSRRRVRQFSGMAISQRCSLISMMESLMK